MSTHASLSSMFAPYSSPFIMLSACFLNKIPSITGHHPSGDNTTPLQNLMHALDPICNRRLSPSSSHPSKLDFDVTICSFLLFFLNFLPRISLFRLRRHWAILSFPESWPALFAYFYCHTYHHILLNG